MGFNTGHAGRLIDCMSVATKADFCNATFRKAFTKVVKYERAFVEADKRYEELRGSASRGFDIQFYDMEAVTNQINSLLRRGLLRREDFSSFLSDEPAWLTEMMGERTQPNPCARA